MNRLLGRSVIFIPHWAKEKPGSNRKMEIAKPQRGRIVYVNERNGWFMVEVDANGSKQHECFKPWDIGKDVTLLGRR